MLAGATKDGKPVHPGLSASCNEDGRHRYPDPKSRTYGPCGEIGCIGWNVNPDPMAMIAAVLAVETYGKKLWTIHFWGDDDVTIGLGGGYHRWEGLNLTDAVFQATKALDPDNWMECLGEWEDGEHYDCHDGQQQRTQTTADDCHTCHGTGKVIRSVDDDGTRTGN